MTKTWVLVADSNVARIYSAPSPLAPLAAETEIANPDIIPEAADRPGRGFGRMGGHRHALAPKVDPKTQGLSMFAKRLAEVLSEGRIRGKFENLVLVAAPHVLGLLRNELDGKTAKLLSREIGKDLVHLEPKALQAYVG